MVHRRVQHTTRGARGAGARGALSEYRRPTGTGSGTHTLLTGAGRDPTTTSDGSARTSAPPPLCQRAAAAYTADVTHTLRTQNIQGPRLQPPPPTANAAASCSPLGHTAATPPSGPSAHQRTARLKQPTTKAPKPACVIANTPTSGQRTAGAHKGLPAAPPAHPPQKEREISCRHSRTMPASAAPAAAAHIASRARRVASLLAPPTTGTAVTTWLHTGPARPGAGAASRVDGDTRDTMMRPNNSGLQRTNAPRRTKAAMAPAAPRQRQAPRQRDAGADARAGSHAPPAHCQARSAPHAHALENPKTTNTTAAAALRQPPPQKRKNTPRKHSHLGRHDGLAASNASPTRSGAP